jgi:ABC-type transport system involved in multi-copper enzyme maturation permease subunit
MKARLGRYSLWQLRDYVFERGIPTLLVGAILFFPIAAIMWRIHDREAPSSQLLAIVLGSMDPSFKAFGLTASLIAVNGIISGDRRRGYFRLLFAKPTSPLLYYSQAFLVNLIGLIVAAAIVIGGFGIIVYPVPIAGAVAFVATCYVGLGGIGFLLSAFTRFDWAVLSGAWFVTLMLRGLYPPGSGVFGNIMNYVLPPAHRLMHVAAPMLRGDSVSPASVAWILGYGAAAFAVGLIVLRRRPLGS